MTSGAERTRAYRARMTEEQRAAERLKMNEYMRKWRSLDNPAYLKMLSDQRKKRTGFTDALYTHRLAEQDGKCAICGEAAGAGRYAALHGDHDHETMAPRGLLCSNCNTALGLFKEDPARMRSAINYLAQWAASDVHDELEGTA